MNDKTEIAAPAEAKAPPPAITHPLGEIGHLLDTMMGLAKDPQVDAEKFKTIATVVRETREDAKREQFYRDKAAAMLEMPVIDKRGKITIQKGNETRIQGTYAVWSDLQRAIAPVLAAHDLALTHDIGHEGAVCLVTPVLQHRNGYVEKGAQMALPLDTSGGKNNTQGAGSAASYGKRHTSIAMLGIRLEDTDDDGWLTALPDEPLNDQQERRIAEGKARWADGPEAYENWFKKLEPKDRAWLIQSGRQKEITGQATGLLEDSRQPASDTPPAKPDTSTAEGWTEKYEADCRGAGSLDELADIQRRGTNALKRLAETNEDLHKRAVKAGEDAHARLFKPEPEGAAAGDDLFEAGGQ